MFCVVLHVGARVAVDVVVGGVGVYLHIPHLTNGASCTYVHIGQASSLGEEGGGTSPSPPTSIGQDPADVDGEVLGGRGGGVDEVLLKRRLGSL